MTPPKYNGISVYARPAGWRRMSTSPGATVTPSTADLYWAAGFLEGEGSFSRTTRNKMSVCADQVSKEPIERLQRMLGGAIHTRKKRNTNWNICHQWYTNSDRARGIMLTLYSLMSPRRREQIVHCLMLNMPVEPPSALLGHKPVNTLELHWAAGFIEAEGHIRANVSPANSLTTHSVTASQVQLHPLLLLRQMFSGTIVDLVPSKGARAKSAFHTWRVNGVIARGVMQTLLPLMSTRRQFQISTAISANHRLCLNRCA
jgi:hypothetical protein